MDEIHGCFFFFKKFENYMSTSVFKLQCLTLKWEWYHPSNFKHPTWNLESSLFTQKYAFKFTIWMDLIYATIYDLIQVACLCDVSAQTSVLKDEDMWKKKKKCVILMASFDFFVRFNGKSYLHVWKANDFYIHPMKYESEVI